MQMPTEKNLRVVQVKSIRVADECGETREEKIAEKHIIFHYLKLAENNIARSILVQMENYIFKTFVEGG
jgi:hypothetical protein